MGLVKAALGSAGGVLADQWKEYFYCEALPQNVLAAKGVKRTSGRSSNTKASDNIITSGSVIAVNEGQCMLIAEQGAIVEFTAEPGEFVWDSSTEPTLFSGDFDEGLTKSWENLKKRFTFGGDTGKDQRVYFFNTKEIPGNKYGTSTPVPFRVVDKNIGLDMDIEIRCYGEYSYKLTNPMLFYKNVCGNISDDYRCENLDSQLKAELLTALQPAFAKISDLGVRYSALPGHASEIADALNEILSEKWTNLRGISIVSFGVSSVTAKEEDENTIKELQRTAVFTNTNMAAAHLADAQAEAMKSAAANEGAGAFMAFAGVNAAQNAGGANAQNLFAMGSQQNTAPAQGNPAPAQGNPAPAAQPSADTWTCSCGTVNTGNFCTQCAKPRPAAEVGWKCPKCGSINKGKFCSQCGTAKPAGVPQYKCDKCGWEPDDPTHPPKFCPNCGDPFDDGDITNK